MLTIPRERLPLAPDARHAALRDYFCDKDASVSERDGFLELTLHWPDGKERHVDPRLDEGLQWWGGGLTRSGMALERRQNGRILTALYDTWTLLGWSQWLAANRSVRDLTILHVDDHYDLAAPRLIAQVDGFRDSITGAMVDFADPQSVIAAILSGALGMGSFLTCFLHAAAPASVRHLRQAPRTEATSRHEIQRGLTPDTLLHPRTMRPSINLRPALSGRYIETSNLSGWLDSIGDGPILLHIDMDYFNNRYDGDSDWQTRAKPLDPPLNDQLRRIDELTGALARSGLGPRIANVAIAYSPGFYPAEYWAAADERLRAALEALL